MAMTILLAALAAQTLPAPDAVRWEQVIDESGGPSFVDPASLERDGDVVRFLNRSDRRVDDRGGVRIMIVRVAIDCRRRKVGFIGGDAYGEGGRFLHSIPAAAGEVQFQPMPTAPGPDRIFRRVCGDTAGGGR